MINCNPSENSNTQNCNCVVERMYTIEYTNDEYLLKGTVIDKCSIPVENAIVLITVYYDDCYSPYEKDIGYVKTNSKGQFCIALKKDCDIDYSITIFNPLVPIC